MSLVNLAGLAGFTEVIVGPGDASIARLYSESRLNRTYLMFLDHYKPAYVPDLKLAEKLRLVSPGSVLAVDNVIKPGNPPYLDYVRKTTKDKRAQLGKVGKSDGMPDQTLQLYKRTYGKMRFNQSPGNPNLVYESKLVDSFEPTGILLVKPIMCM